MDWYDWVHILCHTTATFIHVCWLRRHMRQMSHGRYNTEICVQMVVFQSEFNLGLTFENNCNILRILKLVLCLESYTREHFAIWLTLEFKSL